MAVSPGGAETEILMGGLFQSAHAAQAAAGSQTMTAGNDDSEPVQRTDYEGRPEPVKASSVEDQPPALNEEVPSAPGPFDKALAEFKENQARNSGEDRTFVRTALMTKADDLQELGSRYQNVPKASPKTAVSEPRYVQLADKKDEIFKPARPAVFPSEKDVDDAIKNQAGYADPMDGYFKPGGRRVRTTLASSALELMRHNDKASEERNLDAREEIDGAPTATNENTSRLLLRAWLAVRNVPIAAIGFDPKNMVISDSEKRSDTAGMYMSGDGGEPLLDGKRRPFDTIWVNSYFKTTPVHESIHRGIRLLELEGALPFNLNQLGEELAVRALMEKYYGDAEWGRGSESDKLIEESRRRLPPHVLPAIERAAAKYHAKMFKTDPSKKGPR